MLREYHESNFYADLQLTFVFHDSSNLISVRTATVVQIEIIIIIVQCESHFLNPRVDSGFETRSINAH